jgi:hypothetical protein
MVTATRSDHCTSHCTDESKTSNLDALAAKLLALPEADRAALVAKLLGEGEAKAK